MHPHRCIHTSTQTHPLTHRPPSTPAHLCHDVAVLHHHHPVRPRRVLHLVGDQQAGLAGGCARNEVFEDVAPHVHVHRRQRVVQHVHVSILWGRDWRWSGWGGLRGQGWGPSQERSGGPARTGQHSVGGCVGGCVGGPPASSQPASQPLVPPAPPTWYSARAREMRCFCPPDRLIPFSPISVSAPAGSTCSSG